MILRLLSLIPTTLRLRSEPALENFVLRQQLAVLRSHTIIPASRRNRCTGSIHLCKRNGFCQCTVRFKTGSGLEGTISNQFTSDSSVIGP
jgi:hypothetical protein